MTESTSTREYPAGHSEMAATRGYSATRDRVASAAGHADTDRLTKAARLLERERCGEMLESYIAQGRTEAEVVAYARALLRTDY